MPKSARQMATVSKYRIPIKAGILRFLLTLLAALGPVGDGAGVCFNSEEHQETCESPGQGQASNPLATVSVPILNGTGTEVCALNITFGPGSEVCFDGNENITIENAISLGNRSQLNVTDSKLLELSQISMGENSTMILENVESDPDYGSSYIRQINLSSGSGVDVRSSRLNANKVRVESGGKLIVVDSMLVVEGLKIDQLALAKVKSMKCPDQAPGPQQAVPAGGSRQGARCGWKNVTAMRESQIDSARSSVVIEDTTGSPRSKILLNANSRGKTSGRISDLFLGVEAEFSAAADTAAISFTDMKLGRGATLSLHSGEIQIAMKNISLDENSEVRAKDCKGSIDHARVGTNTRVVFNGHVQIGRAELEADAKFDMISHDSDKNLRNISFVHMKSNTTAKLTQYKEMRGKSGSVIENLRLDEGSLFDVNHGYLSIGDVTGGKKSKILLEALLSGEMGKMTVEDEGEIRMSGNLIPQAPSRSRQKPSFLYLSPYELGELRVIELDASSISVGKKSKLLCDVGARRPHFEIGDINVQERSTFSLTLVNELDKSSPSNPDSSYYYNDNDYGTFIPVSVYVVFLERESHFTISASQPIIGNVTIGSGSKVVVGATGKYDISNLLVGKMAILRLEHWNGRPESGRSYLFFSYNDLKWFASADYTNVPSSNTNLVQKKQQPQKPDWRNVTISDFAELSASFCSPRFDTLHLNKRSKLSMSKGRREDETTGMINSLWVGEDGFFGVGGAAITLLVNTVTIETESWMAIESYAATSSVRFSEITVESGAKLIIRSATKAPGGGSVTVKNGSQCEIYSDVFSNAGSMILSAGDYGVGYVCSGIGNYTTPLTGPAGKARVKPKGVPMSDVAISSGAALAIGVVMGAVVALLFLCAQNRTGGKKSTEEQETEDANPSATQGDGVKKEVTSSTDASSTTTISKKETKGVVQMSKGQTKDVKESEKPKSTKEEKQSDGKASHTPKQAKQVKTSKQAIKAEAAAQKPEKTSKRETASKDDAIKDAAPKEASKEPSRVSDLMKMFR